MALPYKMMVLDIDGTLMPKGSPQVSRRVAKAVKSLQEKGVLVVVATGRTLFAMQGKILNGIKPDYCICSNGAQVLDKNENTVKTQLSRAREALKTFLEA